MKIKELCESHSSVIVVNGECEYHYRQIKKFYALELDRTIEEMDSARVYLSGLDEETMLLLELSQPKYYVKLLRLLHIK